MLSRATTDASLVLKGHCYCYKVDWLWLWRWENNWIVNMKLTLYFPKLGFNQDIVILSDHSMAKDRQAWKLLEVIAESNSNFLCTFQTSQMHDNSWAFCFITFLEECASKYVYMRKKSWLFSSYFQLVCTTGLRYTHTHTHILNLIAQLC